MLFLTLAHIVYVTKASESKCFSRSEAFLMERMNQIKEDGDAEESTLSNQGATGYNTFLNCM